MDPVDIVLKLATLSERLDEVPVGALIVKDKKAIAGGFNTMERDQKSTSHAEIKAIEAAQKILKNWRLDGCEMYVSLEPCIMCSGAIHLSRIKKVYFLLPSTDLSLTDTPFDIDMVNLNNLTYKKQLQNFFKKARERKRYKKGKNVSTV